jgi:AcrR family transcriptional regulator
MSDDFSRGERTRQSILEAAEGLFLSQGYNGTSMRQIAKAAGDIAPSAIYNHFPGKEAIFEALLEERSPYPVILTVFNNLPEESGPEMVAHLFGLVQRIIHEHLSFLSLVLIDMQEFEGATLDRVAGNFLPHLMTFLQRLQNAGGIRQDIPLPALMRSVGSMMVGYAFSELILGSREGHSIQVFPADLTPEWWQEQMVAVLLRGIGEEG